MIFKKEAKLIANAIKSHHEDELKLLIDNAISGVNPVLAMLTIGYAFYYSGATTGANFIKFVKKHYRHTTHSRQISRYVNYFSSRNSDKDFLLGLIYDICENSFTSKSRIIIISKSIYRSDTERQKLILSTLEQELKRQIKMATYTIVDECYNVHLAKSLKELARRCYQSNSSVHVEMVGLPAGSDLAGKRIHIENEKKLVSFLTKLYADGSPTVNVFETEEDTDWFYKIQKH